MLFDSTIRKDQDNVYEKGSTMFLIKLNTIWDVKKKST